MESLYDVAIIGGGPAGSTAATLLARQGRKVVVIEREKFPRFHVGESLLPYSMSAFDRLGVREKLEKWAQPKFGGEIATACGTRSLKFYFKDGFRLKHHSAYQVTRADFDKMLLDNAGESGAEVIEETSVAKLEFRADDVSLNLESKDGATREIRAKYLIDCSGRDSVTGTHFKLKRNYEHLRKFSVFAHFDNMPREEGIDGTLTRLIRGADHWFWIIPLTPTRTSVGLVMDSAKFRQLKKTPEEVLSSYLEEQPVMRERMGTATRATQVYSVGDYSYRNAGFSGDRWLMAGDAAGFIDPIWSTGVFLAILSGEQTADAVDQALKHPGKKKALFKKYDRRLNRVMDIYLRFVSAWYRHEFVEVFSNPTERFQLAPAINAVLAGNIGNSFAIWWRMQLFYLILFVQRFVPLCPRLTLTAKNP